LAETSTINKDLYLIQNSPLFVSCVNGHVRIVQHLLEAGADVTVDKRYEDDHGRLREKGNCLVISTLLGQKYATMIYV